jgi:hypothetical protein
MMIPLVVVGNCVKSGFDRTCRPLRRTGSAIRPLIRARVGAWKFRASLAGAQDGIGDCGIPHRPGPRIRRDVMLPPAPRLAILPGPPGAHVFSSTFGLRPILKNSSLLDHDVLLPAVSLFGHLPSAGILDPAPHGHATVGLKARIEDRKQLIRCQVVEKFLYFT